MLLLDEACGFNFAVGILEPEHIHTRAESADINNGIRSAIGRSHHLDYSSVHRANREFGVGVQFFML